MRAGIGVSLLRGYLCRAIQYKSKKEIAGQSHNVLRKNAFILWSILKSFDSSAYYVLWIKGLQIICWSLDLLLSIAERPFVDKKPGFPIIFVVGIHRTGSTFVSQVLADSTGYAPLGNFTTIFPRSKHLIHKLFKGFYRPEKREVLRKYKSFYGISKGFFAIGDSYEVWDQWFGKDHYNRPAPLSEDKRCKMGAYFNALQNSWGMPVITKNNRNTLVIEDIHKTVSNAFFVVVNRNPADVIQSTMQASRDFFGTDEIIWGLREDASFSPENYADKLDAYCRQYLDLQDSITRSLKALPGEDYMVIQYESFCENPGEAVDELNRKLRAKYDLKKSSVNVETFKQRTSQRLQNSKLSAEINRRIREIRSVQEKELPQ